MTVHREAARSLGERHHWQDEIVQQREDQRRGVVQIALSARASGISIKEIAESVQCSPSTIYRWIRLAESGKPLARPRGRPPVRSTVEEHVGLATCITDHGADTGVCVFQALHRFMPRREVEAVVKHQRRIDRESSPREITRLTWTRPGTVWAIDHTHLTIVTEGSNVVFAGRDLASHQQVLWQPGRETSESVVAQLRAAFEKYGAPLVLKADNGPVFRSAEFLQLLDEYGVELLPSPPYRPEYNGSCEVAHRPLKKRTAHVATTRRGAFDWQRDGLEHARQSVNRTARPWGVCGETPQQRWDRRTPPSPRERARFRQTVERFRAAQIAEKQLSHIDLQNETLARCIQRVAVSRALQEHGLLITRRSTIRPPFKVKRSARIS